MYKQLTLAVALSTGSLLSALKAQDASDVQTPAPDAAVRKIMAGLAQRDATVLYDAAPASYIKDLTSAIRSSSKFVDAETYDAVIAALKQLTKVLETKSDFLFEYPLLSMRMPPAELKAAKEAMPKVIAVLKSVTGNQLGSHKALTTFDLKTFLAKTGNTFLDATKKETVDENGNKLNLFKDSEIVLVSHKGNKATLDLVMPNGESMKKDFSLVEGKWIPTALASEWDSQMKELKQSLSAPPEQAQMFSMMVRSRLGMVTGLLDSLQGAETQQKFNMIIGKAMQPIMQQLMGGGDGPDAGAASSPAQPRPASQPTKK